MFVNGVGWDVDWPKGTSDSIRDEYEGKAPPERSYFSVKTVLESRSGQPFEAEDDDAREECQANW